MEQIRQAVERAKASGVASGTATTDSPDPTPRGPSWPQQPGPVAYHADRLARTSVNLNWRHLERHRILAHNAADPRSKSFDMLRTQVLQSMDQEKWQFLAVTSPTADCGKTVTAINLALSIARQPERLAFLIDMDLQRPEVADYLDIGCQQGLLGILDGRTTLP